MTISKDELIHRLFLLSEKSLDTLYLSGGFSNALVKSRDDIQKELEDLLYEAREGGII